MTKLVYRCITTKRLPYTNTKGERISVRTPLLEPKIYGVGKLESEMEKLDLTPLSSHYDKLHLAAAKLYLKHIDWGDLQIIGTGFLNGTTHVHVLHIPEESNE